MERRWDERSRSWLGMGSSHELYACESDPSPIIQVRDSSLHRVCFFSSILCNNIIIHIILIYTIEQILIYTIKINIRNLDSSVCHWRNFRRVRIKWCGMYIYEFESSPTSKLTDSCLHRVYIESLSFFLFFQY